MDSTLVQNSLIGLSPSSALKKAVAYDALDAPILFSSQDNVFLLKSILAQSFPDV